MHAPASKDGLGGGTVESERGSVKKVKFTPTLKLHLATPDDFVDFWEPRYTGARRPYDEHIKIGEALSSDDLRSLMVWKAGPRFREQAENVANRVNLQELNQYRNKDGHLDQAAVEQLLSQVAEPATKGLIWQIAIGHFARPKEIPLYDVNVWIAWLTMTDALTEKWLQRRPTTRKNYFAYREFFHGIRDEGGYEDRRLDRALMAFGQFLLSDHAVALSSVTPTPHEREI